MTLAPLRDVLNPLNRAPTIQELAVSEAIRHQQAGRVSEAFRILDQQFKSSPNDPQLAFNFGVIAMEAGRLDRAVACYESAARVRPGWYQIHNNLAHCYSQLGRYEDTVASASRAIELEPRNALAYVNMCGALLALGRESEAAEAGRQAVKLEPRNHKAHLNLGVAYRALWELEKAERHYREVTILAPKYANGWADLAQIYSLQGRVADAVRAAEISAVLEPMNPIMRANLILYLDTAPNVTLRDAWAERRVYNALFTRPIMLSPSSHENDRAPDRLLRVGYVSADFRRHSAGYALLPLVEHHDPAAQEVFLYSGSLFKDELTARFEAAAEHFLVTTQLDDDLLARQIRRDRIDVLIDLSAYTSGSRLSMFARRPAPIQVTAWGYATGTGLDAFDIFFADDVTVPEESEPFYSEAVVRLPSIIAYEPSAPMPEPGPLPMLANGYPTLGSFNRLDKLTPEILEVWARVLAAVPDARLVMKFSGLHQPRVAEQVRQGFARCGVDPERLTLLGHTTREQHIAAMQQCDLLLDSWPHGGGITTLEGFSVGLPCVTLLGDRVPGRLSASFLEKVGLEHLIAQDADQYVEIVREAVAQPKVLALIREGLPKWLKDSPMMQHADYVRAVEAALRNAWHGWLSATERKAA